MQSPLPRIEKKYADYFIAKPSEEKVLIQRLK